MNWLTMNTLITQFYSNATYFLLINLYMFIGHQKTIVEKNNEQINKFSQTNYTLTFGNEFLIRPHQKRFPDIQIDHYFTPEP